jgi:hypothetical protein
MSWFGWNKGAGAVVALLGLSCAGCYDWASVRPTELPKLNAAVSSLEKTDGSRFVIQRAVTAKVVTPLGAQKFSQPVSRIDGDILTITGDDVPETHIPLDQINSVRVGQLNPIDTAASLLLLSGVVVGTVVLFFWIRPIWHGNGGVE